MKSGGAGSFSVILLFALVSGERFAYIVTCENVIFFPYAGKQTKLSNILAFLPQKFLAKFLGCPNAQFIVSKKDKCGGNAPVGSFISIPAPTA